MDGDCYLGLYSEWPGYEELQDSLDGTKDDLIQSEAEEDEISNSDDGKVSIFIFIKISIRYFWWSYYVATLAIFFCFRVS